LRGEREVQAAELLTVRDAQVLLGRPVGRIEPSDDAGVPARKPSDFVCFGGRAKGPTMVGEFVSLAAGPSANGARNVPFFSVALEGTRASADNPCRRSVSARWEQNGLRFSLTYTCIALADSDDVSALTNAKREPVAALARLVSDRVSSFLH
jgi:hypothetical protein